MCPQKTKLIPHITLGLVLYLLLFSAFALFHAYANNELTDPLGCQIGEWVQHGQATFFAVILVSTVLACSFYLSLIPDGLRPRLAISGLTARAPPFTSC